jgi:hypothetical protein
VLPEKLLKIFPLMKVDEAGHRVWGCVTSETPDSDGEICDYPSVKKAIQQWSDETLAKTTAAGQEISLGNMRVMHQLEVGGKAVKIEYKDDAKQIWVGSEPADADVWHLLKGGFLTGHSIGGNYLWKKKEGDYTRYAPTIGEISYVDKGSNPDASFAYVKADGTTELRKFAAPGPAEKELLAKIHLSDLDTRYEELRALADDLMGKLNADKTGATTMNPEQLKKAAAALGISEDEFKKLLATGDLEKAKGMAALHGHIQKAMAHHDSMHKAHSEMADMHKAHKEHLAKVHKACKAVMGAEEKDGDEDDAKKAAEAEEVLKAADAKKATDAAAAAAAEVTKGMMTKEQAAELVAAEVAKALKAALDKVPADDAADRAKLFPVMRAAEAAKAEQAKSNDPLPI